MFSVTPLPKTTEGAECFLRVGSTSSTNVTLFALLLMSSVFLLMSPLAFFMDSISISTSAELSIVICGTCSLFVLKRLNWKLPVKIYQYNCTVINISIDMIASIDMYIYFKVQLKAYHSDIFVANFPLIYSTERSDG